MYSPPPIPSTSQSQSGKLLPATTETTLTIQQQPIISDQPFQNHDQPIQVFLVVYDLLPSGKLSDLAWLFGLGLYHTAVKIPTIGREIAFGGHPHPQASGIFSLPIPQQGKPSMPGLRWKCDIEMGYVKTSNRSETRSTCHPHHLTLPKQSSFHHRTSHDDESGSLIRPPPSALKLLNKSSPSSHDQAYPPRSMMLETKTTSPIFHSRSHASSSSSTISDSQTSFSSTLAPTTTTTTTTSTPLETLAAILDQLDRSPDWYGTSYDLLNRNCNAFSAHLCFLLTGEHAPNWINRAATVGATLPCLVPDEFVYPP
ncbi:hypothetical protein VP01_6g4 [Puccinia sorghi]|uniref:PPPDE domain-containing protein n=1 Tax=Puccinia sorghi TaxID=27349 RepID=A0A0L6UEP5_9BASI|nr:hypothetical protein VP01_6g4 [Puccinia sorghi]